MTSFFFFVPFRFGILGEAYCDLKCCVQMKHHIAPDQELRERKIVQKIIEGKRTRETGGARRRRWTIILTIAFLASIVCSIILWDVLIKPQGGVSIKNGSSRHNRDRRSSSFTSRRAEAEIMMLSSALRGFEDTQSLPTIQSLVRHMVVVGQNLADQLPLGVDADGAVVHTLEKGVGDKEVEALLKSSTTLYRTLARIIGDDKEGEEEGKDNHSGVVFPAAVMDIPATVYQWVVSTCFILNYVLPEYYVRHETLSGAEDQRETATHMSVLLQSVNLARWLSANVLNHIPAETAASSLCRTLSEAPKSMKQFCETSFHSKTAVTQRIAANYEELIALSPRYGPFRLHYAAALVDLWSLPIPQVKKGLIQSVIRHDRERAESYGYKDTHHVAILNWIEHIMLHGNVSPHSPPSEKVEAVEESAPLTVESVSEAARVLEVLEAVSSCTRLVRPSIGRTWPVISLHPNVLRPPLFTSSKIREAVSTISPLISSEVVKEFTNC